MAGDRGETWKGCLDHWTYPCPLLLHGEHHSQLHNFKTSLLFFMGNKFYSTLRMEGRTETGTLLSVHGEIYTATTKRHGWSLAQIDQETGYYVTSILKVGKSLAKVGHNPNSAPHCLHTWHIMITHMTSHDKKKCRLCNFKILCILFLGLSNPKIQRCKFELFQSLMIYRTHLHCNRMSWCSNCKNAMLHVGIYVAYMLLHIHQNVNSNPWYLPYACHMCLRFLLPYYSIIYHDPGAMI